MTDPQKLAPKTDRIGTPISDESSEDSLSQIRGLEEDRGIYHNEEVVVSPRNESDDDLPSRRILPDTVSVDHIVEEDSDIVMGDGGVVPNMERRRSVRFSGPQAEEEDGRNKHFRTPSPESLRYIQALENPMAAGSEFENEFKDLTDDPVINIRRPSQPPPLGSPPAYTSGDEGSRTPPPTGPPTNYTEDEIAVLTFIDAYKAQEVELRPQLRPFSIEHIPAMGEVDLFVKVPRPDDIDDNVGLTQIDEPPCNQSDATIVEMQIRSAVKDMTILDDVVPVKVLENADEKPDQIKKWIADVKLPTADLDCSLEEYVDIMLNAVDIPVGKSRIESLYVLFATLQEFERSQHFRSIAQPRTTDNNRGEGTSSNILEL
ncbi:Protein CBR-DYF-6 [Caenorhabditis briggsae]|uniref:Intraflagellar transport protein 46 homolog n=1 Tax=Caenorhabditis briggsae TaxID=6238 RepID=A8XZC4_CAEBR|nr:Protein CBR-DYF-6 [Caenorhabditis briggsae]CAP38051.2 Protein CBR-DYF-6 [Caenorhabditis briggsae]